MHLFTIQSHERNNGLDVLVRAKQLAAASKAREAWGRSSRPSRPWASTLRPCRTSRNPWAASSHLTQRLFGEILPPAAREEPPRLKAWPPAEWSEPQVTNRIRLWRAPHELGPHGDCFSTLIPSWAGLGLGSGWLELLLAPNSCETSLRV